MNQKTFLTHCLVKLLFISYIYIYILFSIHTSKLLIRHSNLVMVEIELYK